jgi:hypothetical protein
MAYLKTTMIILMLAGSAMGQIYQVIDDFSLKRFPSPYTEWRPFVGRFEFQSLPEPMRPVTVNFTLEATLENQYLEGDWGIRITFDPKYMDLIGDTLFTWSEPHPKGSKFSGSFQIVPLTAGLHGFKVELARRGYGHVALAVEWRLDPDGNLELLDKAREKGTVRYSYQPWSFFDKDSIQMRQQYVSKSRAASPNELVEWKATVTPPFRIGDTSTVRYEFVALQNLVHRLMLDVNLRGMDLVSTSEKISPPLMTGDIASWEIKVVPLAVMDVHEIDLHFRAKDPSRPDYPDKQGQLSLRGYRTNTVPLSFIFNNDGTLRLVGNT